MSKKGDKSKILKLFPEIKEIRDKEIAEKTIEVWARIWSESPWENLEDVPLWYNIPITTATTVTHTRSVTKAAMSVAKILSEVHGIKINFDFLISACILHDVSKVIEIEERDGKYEHSDIAKKFTHAYYGAHIAQEVGLPIEIVHLIFTHTAQIPMVSETYEGVILHDVDLSDFNIHMITLGQKTIGL